MTMQRALNTMLAVAIFAFVSVAALMPSVAGAQAAEADNTITVTVSPASGPSGTTTTVTVSGGTPGDPITLTIGAGISSGVIGADGTFSSQETLYGRVGDVITIEAQVGNSADSPSGSATFTITGETTDIEAGNIVAGDAVGGGDEATAADEANTITVTVSPASGPSGTTATVTVSGGNPGDPITLTIGAGTSSGVIGADGSFTSQETFYGQVGDEISVEAQVGNSLDSPKGAATFTITGEPLATAAIQVGGNLIRYEGRAVSIVEGLGDARDSVESVSWFDAETQQWNHWTPAQENLPAILRQTQSFETGRVYWVVSRNAVTWTFPPVEATFVEVSLPLPPRVEPVTRLTILRDGTRIYDTDNDGDGKPDSRTVYRPDGSRLELTDSDHDGKFDSAIRYGPDGTPIDRWDDKNGDGRPSADETTKLPIRTVVDDDRDGKTDWVDIDTDGDGKHDIRVMYNHLGKAYRVFVYDAWDERPAETYELDEKGRVKSSFVDHDHNGIDDRIENPLTSDEYVLFDEDPTLGLFGDADEGQVLTVSGDPANVVVLFVAEDEAETEPVAVVVVPVTPIIVQPPVEVENVEVQNGEEFGIG